MGVKESSPLPAAEEKRAFVREMFDRIAPRYDRMNRLMTLGRDQGWRRAAVRRAGVGPDDLVIDLATGTGDFAELCRSRGARVVAVDLALGMLRAGHRRLPGISFVQADGVALPLPDGAATVVTCGFALRNFVDLDAIFREAARVLTPGGRLVFLEVDTPRSTWLRWGHDLHFRRIVPLLGSLLSDPKAYRYLPESTAYLPPEAELRAALARAGFEHIEKHPHMFGAVQELCAQRALS
jgi:demethylmenaquinone methyltransferase/2-methoxy-6-polyprenyl-1,4-benzoquinol methylase